MIIQSVEFEPIGVGKNVVHVRVANPTVEQKVCVIDVNTHSRREWNHQYVTTVQAGETRDVRCAFCFIGPVTKDASVGLIFYASVLANCRDQSHIFERQQFRLADLRWQTPVSMGSLSQSDNTTVQVRRVFRLFQQCLRKGAYGDIWDSVFTRDYQDGCFKSLDTFEKAMTGVLPTSTYFWDRDMLLSMRPASISRANDQIFLSVTNGEETWQINFILSESDWRIDWINGYEPSILHLYDDEDARWRLLLARTEAINTQHFEIHYYKNSTAERELNAIAQTREQGYASIVEFLGVSGLPSDRKISLFLFEDMKTKFLVTGYVGLGVAGIDEDGNGVLLEVYNKKQFVDAYHETTHILMSPYGEPPALLNEGIAVYLSERFGGASALRNLCGKVRSLYAGVRRLKQKGDWISLKELLTYTNIGSQESRSALAYIEAGAFVKYLIETYGKELFLKAYKELTNSADPDTYRQNQQSLERIYNFSLQSLEEDWERSFMLDRL